MRWTCFENVGDLFWKCRGPVLKMSEMGSPQRLYFWRANGKRWNGSTSTRTSRAEGKRRRHDRALLSWLIELVNLGHLDGWTDYSSLCSPTTNSYGRRSLSALSEWSKRPSQRPRRSASFIATTTSDHIDQVDHVVYCQTHIPQLLHGSCGQRDQEGTELLPSHDSSKQVRHHGRLFGSSRSNEGEGMGFESNESNTALQLQNARSHYIIVSSSSFF